MTSESTFPIAAALELLETGATLDRELRKQGASKKVLAEPAAVGLDLVEALDLAQRSERGMIEYSVALELAEDASERLCRALVRSGLDVELLETG